MQYPFYDRSHFFHCILFALPKRRAIIWIIGNKNVEKMEWEEIKKCAVLGNAVAGLCVQKRGGIPAIPTKEAVFEFMQK